MPTYAQLTEEFPLRPIRSNRKLELASRLAFRLAAQKRLSRDAQDYLEVLSQLIATYEAEHHAIEPEASPQEMLRFLIDENGLTLSQLSTETGIKVSTLSAILHGKRAFNIQHVARLAARFRVDPGLFVQRVAAAV